MCEFCDSLTDNTKKITWQVRSTYADDNICEFVNDENCDVCEGCKMWFKIDGYDYDGNAFIGITYNQELTSTDGKQVIIRPFSESIQFNFCPICGKQISKEVKEFEKYYQHQISIDEK